MTENLPTIIVPARLASVRYPRKLLEEVNGVPLILLTAKRLRDIAPEFDTFFAVDGDELESVLVNNGFQTVRTSPDLPSGTDRIFEANQKLQRSKVINVQADEPLVSREHITSLLNAINRSEQSSMATLAVPFADDESFKDRNQVKVVLDQRGYALYFSRLPIPAFREKLNFDDFQKFEYKPLKHLGMYAYTGEFLEKFSNFPPTCLERIEKLEQLRALEMGVKISVSIVQSGTIGIDVPEDLRKLDELSSA